MGKEVRLILDLNKFRGILINLKDPKEMITPNVVQSKLTINLKGFHSPTARFKNHKQITFNILAMQRLFTKSKQLKLIFGHLCLSSPHQFFLCSFQFPPLLHPSSPIPIFFVSSFAYPFTIYYFCG